MAKVINFDEFKNKQEHIKLANVSISEILNFDVDLSNEWHDVVKDVNCMENQYVGANSKSNLDTTFYKLCKSILISIKKCVKLKVL